MDTPMNLATVSVQDFKRFINSFDTVLSDCDGVLYFLSNIIPGVVDTIEKLRCLNKKIYFLSNNTTMTLEQFHKKLNQFGFNAGCDDIIFPTLSIIAYLKNINFTKKVFVISVSGMRTDLVNAGIKIVENGPIEVEETFTALLHHIKDDEEIGAVIMDMDINMNYIKLMKAVVYLKRPDVLFLAGATDTRVPIGTNNNILGPGLFLQTLEEFTGRKATIFGKPSQDITQYVNDKFQITDPKRTLFIGDSLYQDISFANKCGYQKLFVLTGLNNLDDARLACGTYKPDYYLNSLADLCELLETKL